VLFLSQRGSFLLSKDRFYTFSKLKIKLFGRVNERLNWRTIVNSAGNGWFGRRRE
jgi:hypothetical protein